ncbi:MAG: hypothetical protein M1822_005968 [Bathelium mastoideum]|nr:MAG: hypothetical protein M1822_005968 [Bathelium mastoideum]
MPSEYPTLTHRAITAMRNTFNKSRKPDSCSLSSSTIKLSKPGSLRKGRRRSIPNFLFPNAKPTNTSYSPASAKSNSSFTTTNPHNRSGSTFSHQNGRCCDSAGSISTKLTSADSASNGRSRQDVSTIATTATSTVAVAQGATREDEEGSVPPGALPIGTCMGEPPVWWNASIGEGRRRSKFVEVMGVIEEGQEVKEGV